MKDSDDRKRTGRPTLSTRGARRTEARKQRLAKALRENLARRKAQLRARGDGGSAPESDDDPTR